MHTASVPAPQLPHHWLPGKDLQQLPRFPRELRQLLFLAHSEGSRWRVARPLTRAYLALWLLRKRLKWMEELTLRRFELRIREQPPLSKKTLPLTCTPDARGPF